MEGSVDANREAHTVERPRGEHRWPMAAAVLAAIVLQVIEPRHGRLTGWWIFPILEAVMLVIVIARDPGRIDRRTRAARRATIILIALVTAGNVASAVVLLVDIVAEVATVGPATLLGRGAAVWLTNVLVFSLWYWELDRGGPAERAARTDVRPTFAFPENATPELVEEGWSPRYPDYLYLSFTNATAFSPTDTLPLKTWAKMTMLVQSLVSLVIGILVIARAINVFPPSG